MYAMSNKLCNMLDKEMRAVNKSQSGLDSCHSSDFSVYDEMYAINEAFKLAVSLRNAVLKIDKIQKGRAL
jgi:hypothetical protein